MKHFRTVGRFCLIVLGAGCQKNGNDGITLALLLPTTTTTTTTGGGTGTGSGTGTLVTSAVTVGSLLWQRCAIGQSWNATGSNCRGAGSVGDEYGAQLLSFCSSDNNNCNGGSATGTLTTPTGGSQSESLAACAELVTSGHTDWRLPTKDELKSIIVCPAGPATPLADYAYCVGTPIAATLDASLFPDAPASEYWSAGSASNTTSWSISFEDGHSDDSAYKSFGKYVRCVAPAP